MATVRHVAALGLQAAGSGATLLANAAIAAGFGLGAQGEFALAKSWVDALAVIFALGLPQGLLHMLYRSEASGPALWCWTRRYLLGVLAVAAAAAAVPLLVADGGTVLTQVAIALAVPPAVAYQLWRSLVLRGRGVVVFGAVTAAPALLLLALVLVWLVSGRAQGFGWMILASWWMAALTTYLLLRPARPEVTAACLDEDKRCELWTTSLQSVLHTGAAALLPAALLSLTHRISGSVAVVGELSLGLQVYVLFAIAAAYVAPMVYDASARGHANVLLMLRRLPWRVRWLPPALALLGPLLVAQLWPAMHGRVLLSTVLALAGVVALYARVLTTVLQAEGGYTELSVQALWRLSGACLGALAMANMGLDPALAAALGLLAIETATAGRLAALLERSALPEAAPALPSDAAGRVLPQLVMITTNHPFTYKGGETMFVEGELPALAAAFPGMVVAPLHDQGTQLPLPTATRLDRRLARLFGTAGWRWYARAFAWPGMGTELWRGWRRGGLIGASRVWRWAAQASATWHWLRQALPREGPLLLYTYWRGGATLACVRFASTSRAMGRHEVRVVSRVHGYDLYEDRFIPPFQPWLSMYEGVDRILAISRHGAQALRRQGVPETRIRLARLGTDPSRAFGGPSTDGLARVVSCSSVIPLKRVPLIARSVMEFARRQPGRRVQWTHIGDGPELGLVRQALADAPPNLEADIRGAMPHAAVLSYFAEQPVDVFLLLSETEGLPVSVQEALAHAIPVVATDVGGVGEAVDSEVGCLLPPHPDPTMVADALDRLLAEAPADHAARRRRAVTCWARDFDARANRRALVAELYAVLAAAPLHLTSPSQR